MRLDGGVDLGHQFWLKLAARFVLAVIDGLNAAAREGRRGLHGAVDEIVESVLDAADEDILQDLGGYGERELGGELLRQLMLDGRRRSRGS